MNPLHMWAWKYSLASYSLHVELHKMPYALFSQFASGPLSEPRNVLDLSSGRQHAPVYLPDTDFGLSVGILATGISAFCQYPEHARP